MKKTKIISFYSTPYDFVNMTTIDIKKIMRASFFFLRNKQNELLNEGQLSKRKKKKKYKYIY